MFLLQQGSRVTAVRRRRNGTSALIPLRRRRCPPIVAGVGVGEGFLARHGSFAGRRGGGPVLRQWCGKLTDTVIGAACARRGRAERLTLTHGLELCLVGLLHAPTQGEPVAERRSLSRHEDLGLTWPWERRPAPRRVPACACTLSEAFGWRHEGQQLIGTHAPAAAGIGGGPLRTGVPPPARLLSTGESTHQATQSPARAGGVGHEAGWAPNKLASVRGARAGRRRGHPQTTPAGGCPVRCGALAAQRTVCWWPSQCRCCVWVSGHHV